MNLKPWYQYIIINDDGMIATVNALRQASQTMIQEASDQLGYFET